MKLGGDGNIEVREGRNNCYGDDLGLFNKSKYITTASDRIKAITL